MKSLLVAASAIAVLAGAASAQEGPFRLGAGYQAIDTDGLTYDTLSLRGSYDITPMFAVEGEFLAGMGDETNIVGTARVTSEINYGAGVYGVARLPIGEQFSVFARGGYAFFDTSAPVSRPALASDVDGWAFGAGAEWAFSGPHSIRVDYTRYDFVNGKGDADALGVSFVRRF
ncbi:MAG: porin family protein [Caulobacterales bacterium]|uniref:porin family protein n=1 Tax=Glycocaulis sp. TaxID=1969725 RepID=UPI003FA184AB